MKTNTQNRQYDPATPAKELHMDPEAINEQWADFESDSEDHDLDLRDGPDDDA